MGVRKPKQVLIPFHFGHRWDIIPNRLGDWDVVQNPRIADRLKDARQHRPDVLVSGDCMAAIAAHRPELDLVWLDAHGDFNTLVSTETGNIGGMPLAMLLGIGDTALLEFVGVKRVMSAVHVGGCDFDPGELDRMSLFGVAIHGPIYTPCNNRRLHLHIDTDVISSDDLPSSIHPPSNGMSLETFYLQLEALLPMTDVLSIKSCDPRLDASRIGEGIVLEILRRFYNA